MDIQAAIRKSGLVLGFSELKDKQVEAMSSFLKGKDTFPTGYGKSIIYAALPLVFDYVKGMYLSYKTSGQHHRFHAEAYICIF